MHRPLVIFIVFFSEEMNDSNTPAHLFSLLVIISFLSDASEASSPEPVKLQTELLSFAVANDVDV